MDNISKFPDLGGELTREIIGSAIDVHRHLGPGLLESTYEACLLYELKKKGFNVQAQVLLPIQYKEVVIEQAYRLDLWINNSVVLELKACDKIQPICRAQIITYMKLSKSPLGLLINFNEKLLKDGIERFALEEFNK